MFDVTGRVERLFDEAATGHDVQGALDGKC